MSRELKFRAWDKSMGRMLQDVGVHPHMCCINEDYAETESGAYTISPAFTNYELMQFTGLHDKNGVEIYEGDIVLHEAFPGAKSGKEVVFLDGWVLNSKGLETDVWKLTRNTRYSSEVIGNIHENPELLTTP